MRTLAHVIGMLLLGLGALAAVPVLLQLRMGTPLEAPDSPAALARGGPPATPPAAATPLERLAGGIRADLAIARSSLADGPRSRLTRALDAAGRASDVGRHAAASPGPFEAVHRAVQRARIALQDGNPGDVDRILRPAAGAFGEGPRPGFASSPPPAALEDYRGATVIDAQGIRVGEVTAAHEGRLVVAVGGRRDVFGFIDLSGGRRIRVPIADVLFGQPRVLGETLVALPSSIP